jgi:hypothetical protein
MQLPEQFYKYAETYAKHFFFGEFIHKDTLEDRNNF